MNLIEFDNWLNSFLKKEDFLADISLNGIQIENSKPQEKQIKKVAFAVDACVATAQAAVEAGADVLVVHHGLFWGHCQTVTGSHYKRISEFIKNDLALCAYHIPLDANDPYGNNFGVAHKLGMKNLEAFGSWRGMTLGVKGELPEELTVEQLVQKYMRDGQKPVVVLKKGKEKIKTVGIISGGGGEDVESAVEQKLDCYITGEVNHEQYHYIEEMGINVIGGGHYETEVVGVSLLMEKVKNELGLETVFIDVPTGL